MGEYLEKYNKKMLDIDLLDLTFNEIYETAYFYWYNGVRYRCFEPDIEIVSTKIGDESGKKLVRSLDNHNSNQNT